MKKVSKALLWAFCIVMVCTQSAAAKYLDSQDDTKAKAKELWELAIAAKGGREKLEKVRAFSVSSEDKKVVDFMVFPDRFFSWADTRPSKIGLLVEMFNFEHNIDYAIFGDSPPDIQRKNVVDPQLGSRLLDPQLYYLLETKWFKPELLAAYQDSIGGKKIDVVELRVNDYGTPYRFRIFLDNQTHLPLRVGALSNRSNEMFDWVDLSGYKEISGIQVPTLISSQNRRWEKVILEINPDYDPQVFEQQPDVKAGAFQWRPGAKQLLARQTQDAAKAKELWELAIAAKGGREKLQQVRAFAVGSDDKSIDFMVFPDRFFRWADTRPSKFGLLVEMFNFEKNFGFTIWGDDPPDVRKHNYLNEELLSRFREDQLYFFLETQWLKPELLKAYKDNLNGKRVDVVEARFRGFGDPFRWRIFLDETSHLPVRIGILSDTYEGMFDWVDLGDYREIKGIKVPTSISPKNSTWNRILLEINPDYQADFFDKQPDMKAGAFQWRKDGKKLIPLPSSTNDSPRSLTQEQIAQYIKDLTSTDSEKVMFAGRELIRAGEQVVPNLSEATKSDDADLRFFAAVALLAINRENDTGLQTMKSLLLDARLMPDFRQNAAFRLMHSDKGIVELRGLLKYKDVVVRRCVIFAFDELTELTEIPETVIPAIPILKELKKDKDIVVRGMAEEILEQIACRRKNIEKE